MIQHLKKILKDIEERPNIMERGIMFALAVLILPVLLVVEGGKRTLIFIAEAFVIPACAVYGWFKGAWIIASRWAKK